MNIDTQQRELAKGEVNQLWEWYFQLIERMVDVDYCLKDIHLIFVTL